MSDITRKNLERIEAYVRHAAATQLDGNYSFECWMMDGFNLSQDDFVKIFEMLKAGDKDGIYGLLLEGMMDAYHEQAREYARDVTRQFEAVHRYSAFDRDTGILKQGEI